MSIPAIRIEGLGKRYLLGETHENTLSDRLARVFEQVIGRGNLSQVKTSREFWAIRDIDLEVQEGEAVGIIGGNGAGKSTLLKILSRITPPTRGRALVRGRLSSLLEVGTGFHPELTGRENVFLNGTILGMRKREVAQKFDEIVAFSGVGKFIDTPVKRYSSGMYVRLAFAVAAHLEPDVLIVDEVLAVGDAEFQRRCLGKMRDVASEGRTVLFVSHDMAAIRKLCKRALWLDQGEKKMLGDSGSIVDAYLLSSLSGVTTASQRGHKCFECSNAQRDEWEGTKHAYVTSVELYEPKGAQKETLSVWDDVTFRIGFKSMRTFPNISIALVLSTSDNVKVIWTSTSQVHNMTIPVEPGQYYVDCVFRRFPLAAGEYFIGIRIAEPGIAMIWQDEALCTVDVHHRDVFSSGRTPAVGSQIVITPNSWSEVRTIEAADAV